MSGHLGGRFITFEGIDGAGKSTHIESVIDWLESKGVALISTREPGGTELGESIRQLVLQEEMDLECEALLMFAARREHLAKVIEPSLKKGVWVLSDRFTDATFAYQGAGGGIRWSRLNELEVWVQGDRQPDLTFLFDIDPIAAERRVSMRGGDGDKFEEQSREFFARVRQGYLQRVSEHRERFVVINAEASIEDVRAKVLSALSKRTSQWLVNA
jgi:dTMP kinase